MNSHPRNFWPISEECPFCKILAINRFHGFSGEPGSSSPGCFCWVLLPYRLNHISRSGKKGLSTTTSLTGNPLNRGSQKLLPRVPTGSPHPPSQGRPPGGKAYSGETNQPYNLRPLLIKAVTRMESSRHPQGTADLGQLRLKKADDSPAVNASDLYENIWTGPRYLGRLLAKLGYRSPLAAMAQNIGSRRPSGPQDLPPIQEIQAQVREVCQSYLKYDRGWSWA